jgi:hypothetical protein
MTRTIVLRANQIHARNSGFFASGARMAITFHINWENKSKNARSHLRNDPKTSENGKVALLP